MKLGHSVYYDRRNKPSGGFARPGIGGRYCGR
nr:MAG TPA: hypothetical protein [Caudoviricetes sp.]